MRLSLAVVCKHSVQNEYDRRDLTLVHEKCPRAMKHDYRSREFVRSAVEHRGDWRSSGVAASLARGDCLPRGLPFGRRIRQRHNAVSAHFRALRSRCRRQAVERLCTTHPPALGQWGVGFVVRTRRRRLTCKLFIAVGRRCVLFRHVEPIYIGGWYGIRTRYSQIIGLVLYPMS
jgi:hypothetical protein